MRMHASLGITMAVALLSSGLLAACSDSSQQGAAQERDQSVAAAQQMGSEVKSDVKQGVDQLDPQASAMASAQKQMSDDAAITSEVRASLAKDPTLSALNIDVDTLHGKVTLDGSAPDAAAQMRATQLVQAVKGVTAVDNRLVVKTS